MRDASGVCIITFSQSTIPFEVIPTSRQVSHHDATNSHGIDFVIHHHQHTKEEEGEGREGIRRSVTQQQIRSTHSLLWGNKRCKIVQCFDFWHKKPKRQQMDAKDGRSTNPMRYTNLS